MSDTEWEIGVRLVDDHDKWEHYHLTAETREEAVEEAKDRATGVGIDSIASIDEAVEVYMVEEVSLDSVRTVAADEVDN